MAAPRPGGPDRDTGPVHDPREGVDPDGCIRTGAHRSRVPAAYEPVVTSLVSAVAGASGTTPVSLYLYGSVATGTARVPASDVDAVTVGLGEDDAAAVSARLSEQFAGVCRSVDVGAAQPQHWSGDGDAAYGNRVFLRHYCAHLTGPDVTAGWPAFQADARAARGFNGDLAAHHHRWTNALDAIDDTHPDAEPAVRALARRAARKTLLAAAGLVSVRHRTWTTDRAGAAQRLAEDHPPMAGGLMELVAWSTSARAARPDDVRRALDPRGAVHLVVDAFADEIGMWR